MPSHRLIPSVLTLAAMALLGFSGCPAPEHRDPAVTGEAEPFGRFTVQRLALKRDSVLIRTDTATGQAWHMRLLGGDPWVEYREGKQGIPSPDGTTPGRYEIWPETQRRGAPTLVRVDSLTGLVWRTASTGVGFWVPVAETGPGGADPDPAADADMAAEGAEAEEAP
jgi:hypothetical protein